MATDTNTDRAAMFGRRLASVRKFRGLRQWDLADLIGTNRYTISKWERGTRVPDAHEVALMCAALDCSADYLLGLSETVTRGLHR